MIVTVADPINGHDVVNDGEDRFLDDADVAGVRRVGGKVVLGFVAAVERVGEGDGGGCSAVDRACGDMEDLVERDQAVEIADHRVDLGRLCVLLDLEEDHVFDNGLGRRRRRHLGGEFEGKRGFDDGEVFGMRESEGKWRGKECAGFQR